MFVLAVLAAQYAGSFDLYDTTRIDARSVVPVPIVPISGGRLGREVLAGDLATTGMARLRLRGPRSEYSIAYTPTLTVADVELAPTTELLHSGYVAAGWVDRDVRFTLSESGSFGSFNSTYLYAQPGPAAASGAADPAGAAGANGATGGVGPGVPVGTPGSPGTAGNTGMSGTTGTAGAGGTTATTANGRPESIQFGSTGTTATLSVVADHRTTMIGSVGYLTSGGLTPTAKLVLPEQYGPLAILAFSYASSRRDSLSTIVTGQEMTTSGACPAEPGQPYTPTKDYCVVHTPLLAVQEAIRHNLSPTETMTLSLGVFASVAQTRYIKAAVINPSAAVSYTERLSAKGTHSFTASLGMTPTVDIRTGLPVNRAQASAALSDRLAARATVTFIAGLLQSLPFPVADPYPLTNVTGGVDTQFHLDRQLDVGLGLQVLWQNQSSYVNLESTIAYVNVTARLSTLHF